MEKDSDLREAIKGTKNTGDDVSWFRGTPHYWAEASLPLAYAVACVEVVRQNCEKAGALYDKIVEACSDARSKAVLFIGNRYTTLG